jgi:hypothetical protein
MKPIHLSHSSIWSTPLSHPSAEPFAIVTLTCIHSTRREPIGLYLPGSSLPTLHRDTHYLGLVVHQSFMHIDFSGVEYDVPRVHAEAASRAAPRLSPHAGDAGKIDVGTCSAV